MATEIKAPTFPESIQDGTIATWHKKAGDTVSRDELLVDIETDKVVLEVVSPTDGTLTEVLREEGATIVSNEVIALVEAGAGKPAKPASSDTAAEADDTGAASGDARISPAARKLIQERGLDADMIRGTGKGGLITKEDVMAYKAPDAAGASEQSQAARSQPAVSEPPMPTPVPGERIEKRVPMTRMRTRIAERLLQVTQNTAMLTTFNEVDMKQIMDLRKQYKDLFEKVHNGTRLGLMSFFVRAATEALKRFPLINASIDGNDIVYHGYQDIGVAVSTDRGLVVPVLRDADQMSMAETENKIVEFGTKARDGKLTIEEMTGGTFTITNGGVFGSLLSTPIINPPQTAILGMHSIQERPVAIDGQVVIRPMMYLALSYDHRLIDGKEAVQFLVAIKEMIENPAKILLEL